ncbi:MAG TPA: hypothetical protein DDZ51_16865 [Planctomycetaceae bacterium]|nr:hypothetical protein [Planctomycetaceae bacterium]
MLCRLLANAFAFASFASVATYAMISSGNDVVPITFEHDIRPLLKAHCWHCHGEEAAVEGNLDLRLVRSMHTGGDSGPAVIAGKADESLIVQRVVSGEMPPGDVEMPAEDLAKIRRWIEQGATTSRPEPETLAVGDIFTDIDREHWSFQPIRKPDVPDVPADVPVANPIDAFLWQKLNEKQLSFSPLADRETLIRRLSFNLHGLPPSPEAIADFVSDTRPDAYERLVETMLDSPAYGERWGRHWLDIAGYADSDGYTSKDTQRQWSYKYRDYVINSLNDDKPWKDFIVEQLAGDELVPLPYQNLSSDAAEKLIATGFLRMGPDGTSDGSADQNVARNDVIAETIKIVSTSLLGMTVGCAQCHSHRYDPISHVDYHRIRAIFEPAYDWKNWRSASARLVSQWSDETRTRVEEVEKQLKELADQRSAELDQIVADTFERELAKLPEEIQAAAREARQAADKDRTPEQKQLIKEYPFLKVDRGSVYLYLPDRLRKFNDKWDKTQADAKALRPADDLIFCLTEVAEKVPETKLFYRGDINQPREVVAPGELAIINPDNVTIPEKDPNLPTTGRRLAYAKHLTSGQHPLVARVLVNRFWMHHFGRGIVATPSDFGILGQRPTHPELLDWLATDFVENGWSLKRLHRLILTSHAYRQSSVRRDELDAIDPDNLLLGRMSVRRLEAEVVRDALLAVSGQISYKMSGSPVPVAPDDVGQIVVAADNRDSAGRPSNKVVPLGEEEFRRTVYVQVRRSMPLTVLEPFDMPSLAPNCEIRTQSTVAPQSLMMMNSPFVIARMKSMAQQVVQQFGDAPATLFTQAWLRTQGKTPASEDVESGIEFLSGQIEHFKSTAKPDAAPDQPTIDALATLCQALVCSSGFLYVD